MRKHLFTRYLWLFVSKRHGKDVSYQLGNIGGNSSTFVINLCRFDHCANKQYMKCCIATPNSDICI